MIQEKPENKQLKQKIVAESYNQLSFQKLITKILHSSSLDNYHISRNTYHYANVQSKLIIDLGNTDVKVYCTTRVCKQNIAKILEVSKMNTSSIYRYQSDEQQSTTKLKSKFDQYKRKKYQNQEKNQKNYIQQANYQRSLSTMQTISTIRQNNSFAYMNLASNFTISQPCQSQYFIIYALSYRNIGQCKICLITYDKMQNNFKDQCNLLKVKNQQNNKSYIVTIKWLNLSTFICGTNNGYLILCQPQNLLKQSLNSINTFMPDEKDEFGKKNNGKGYEIYKISIAPITQIHIITKFKSPSNQRKIISNQYSCIQLQKFAALTKHQQVFICGFYQINHIQNVIRLFIQVLHRFCCTNASLLIQLHSINDDLTSKKINQTHLLSSIVKDNQVILTQGSSSGVIKTWKVPTSRRCGTTYCQKMHTVSQCIEQYINTKLGKQQIKAQQIERDEKQLQQKYQKSKQKQFRENLQKSIKHNTIVMIDDMVVQGYLPSSLLNDMSYLQHNESTVNYIQNTSNKSICNYFSDDVMQPEQTRVQNVLQDIISQEKSAALTENYPKINDKTESSLHFSILCRQKKQPLCKLEAVNLINRKISQVNNQNNIGNQTNIFQKFIDIQCEQNKNQQPSTTLNKQDKRKFQANGVQQCQTIGYLQNKQRENKNLSQTLKGYQNNDLVQQNINCYLFPQNINKKQQSTQLTQLTLPHIPCKYSIIPLSLISSLFINTTLLQLQYYGHLLVCITSDGNLSIVAMDVPTEPSFQSIHNYEVLMIYKIFRCRKQYGSKNLYEQQQYQEFVNLQIIGMQFYITLNKMYYSHSGKTSQLIQSYIKKLKFDHYLGIKQVEITILTMPHMGKQDSSVQQLFHTQIQKIHLLNPKSVVKCKNKVHLNCQQNCQLSIYGLLVKNQKGIYVFNNVIVRSHGLFSQYNSQNQQADFQKYRINKLKLQMDMRQIGVKYI